LFGEATKFAQAGLDADKSYRATIRLGQTSTTGDAEGILSSPVEVACGLSEIEATLADCLGAQKQVPPMYSALKHQGRPLYAYARAGQEIERTARLITIYAMRLVSWQTPDLVVEVRCSKGTYIRSLAETIGARLGCGGYLLALRRTGLAEFVEDDLVSMETIAASESLSNPGADGSSIGLVGYAPLDRLLLPIDALIASWPEVALSDAQSKDFIQGRRLACALAISPPASGQGIRVKDSQHRFLGIGQFSLGVLSPKRLVASDFSSTFSSLGDITHAPAAQHRDHCPR
jgi:tRNA pseudouridine55 synthase